MILSREEVKHKRKKIIETNLFSFSEIHDLIDTIDYLQKYAAEYAPESSKGCPFCTSDNGKNRKFYGFCKETTRIMKIRQSMSDTIDDLRRQVEGKRKLKYEHVCGPVCKGEGAVKEPGVVLIPISGGRIAWDEALKDMEEDEV